MKREKGLDFVRAIGAIGVVAFHFYVHSNSTDKLFLTHANGAWGGTLNYLFFMLSGIVLHMKYGCAQKIDLKRFYYKRWKATMPAYLFSFMSTFILQAIKSKQFFHSPVPLYRILFSFVGMDAYLNLFFPTFFLIGEWFLSAILLLYAVYPLINCLMKKSVALTFLGLSVLYLSIFRIDYFGVPTTVSLIPCLLCLYIGMLFAHSPKFLKSPAIALIATVCCTVFLTVPIGEAYLSEEILIGATLLISLNFVGDRICTHPFLDRLITVISRYSFFVFLVQHRLIIKVLDRYNPSDTMVSLFLLIGIILAALVFSHNFGIILKWILSSKLYLKFEQAIIGNNQ